ncbi:Type I Iterative PKS [Clathrus columnatus]|uniref:Type I Iterative PKS n=1 Tax=Clathrus columnatus TaxID=1419009 RepID=A0AAV5A586_9AGAM|nr:Type I Iterative PKS [Clathrus columnatus]
MTKSAPSYSNPDPHAVAIVGLSLCAPGATGGLDTKEFHEFLRNRGSGIIRVPSYRWNGDAYHGTAPGKAITVNGGFIPNFEYADVQEFGITPTEAGQANTVHFIVLHQAFNALQRSGVDYRATNTGVFVGCHHSKRHTLAAYYMTGTALSITANRINYVFDLLGPSTAVDTACSATLTAMHLAVQAIRNGDCDQAVVAGVNIVACTPDHIALSQLGVLSPDGISKSFDDDADGYARSDTAGAVVIKRHDLAVRDNDFIHATLVGTSLTSCGSLMGSLTTPNPEAQAQAIRKAYQDAGLEPHHTDFVELHGTGTVVGDSIEANCAGEVFSRGREGREILIGSVKSNVGHGEISAYMSSLTKVVLMLSNKEVLPNGYFKKPSRNIHFDKYKLRVPITIEEFVPQDPQRGLIASISGSGFGGACGHTVLREHEKRPKRSIPGFGAVKGPYLFTMGALTLKSCNTLLREYKAIHSETDPLTLCEHLGRRTRQMVNRTYAVASSFQTATFLDPVSVGKRPNPLVFCFSGQGPQHWNQGRDLMTAYPAFRDSIIACDEIYKAYVGESFLDKTGLFSHNTSKLSQLEKSLIWPAEIISVSIAFFQIAMFDLLVSLRIQPTAIVGHSIGETAVLYASGAASREMAVKVAIARGRALGIVDNKGGSMVAVSGCDADAVRGYIDAASALSKEDGGETNQLYLSAFNSPSDIGVSGPEELLQPFAEYINRWVDGATARKLRVSTAVHSPFVAPCEESYCQELHTIFSQHPGDHLPSIPVISTVTGEVVSEPYTVDYLWKNIRQPVLFSTAIPKIVERYGELTTFVEISPHPVLSQYIKSMGAHDSVGTGYRPPSSKHLKGGASARTEVHAFLDTIGRLLLFGVNFIDFSLLNGYPSETLPDVEYPFNKKLWLYANVSAPPASYQRWLLPPTRILNSTRLRVGPQNPEPWMAEHIIDHSNFIPASAYVEMILEFPGVTEVWDCRFETMCILYESVPPSTLEVSKNGIDWFIKSSTALQNTQGDFEWAREGSPPFDIVHSRGKLSYGIPKLGPNPITRINKDELLKRLPIYSTKEELYGRLGSYSQFGPQFMRIERFYMNERETLAWIRGHDEITNKTDYDIHPAILDAVFQLPHSLRRAFRNDGKAEPLPLPEEFCAYAVLVEWTPTYWVVDEYILDESGAVIFTIEGLRFAWVEQEDALPTTRFTDCWQPHALPIAQRGRSISTEAYSLESDAIELLKVLDELAVSYTKAMLASLPKDFAPDTPASQRYLACCKNLIVGMDSEAPQGITESIQTQFKDIIQLTNTVELLISSRGALGLLSQDDVINRVYDGRLMVDTVLKGFITQFMDLINAAVAAGKHVIRVLEIGARRGCLTKLLGQKLVNSSFEPGYYVDYVCSDTDLRSAQMATTLSPWMTTTPAVFDPTVSIEEQTLEPASFDIIVALDTLNKYSNAPVLANLRYMLVPGGYLAAIQWDSTSFAKSAIGAKWINFVFGSEMESLPLFSEWEVTLKSAGYVDHIFLTQRSGYVGHIAFISQKSNSITNGIPNRISEQKHPKDLTIIRHFSGGDEPALVAFLSDLNLTEPYSIWLHTDTTPSNAALLGLSRSLCHEFIGWKISTVLFHPSWDVSRQREFISEQLIPLKFVRTELKVDELGAISVPRVIEAPAYPTTEPRGSKAVQFDDTKVWRHYPPILHETDVEIAVSFASISPLFPGCSEFSGVVTAAGKLVKEESNLIGKRVVGIVSGHNGNVVVCPRSRVVVIPDDLSLSMGAALVGRLAFISSTILEAIPSNGCRVVLHAGDCSFAALATYAFLKANNFEILVTSTQYPDSRAENELFNTTSIYPSNDYPNWVTAVRKFSPKGVDFAISFDSDSSVSVETTRVLAAGGTFVQVGADLPSQLNRGQRYVSVDYASLAAGEDLLEGLEDVPTTILNSLLPKVEVFDLGQLSTAHEKKVSSPLNTSVLLDLENVDPGLPITRPGLILGTVAFNPHAAYVLIGGIGGLGISLASYMVHNGARHIVVTSRSGAKASCAIVDFTSWRLHIRQSLEDISFIREKNIVQYLRSIPDVTVDIVAMGYLDVARTKELFGNMEHPVAGVFFLPARLNDQPFVNLKTKEDWNMVYDVKIKGLQVLLEAVDPASLDFLVVTSTTFILSGQTNYTAAQYQLALMVDGLPNTVCVVIPPVLDFGTLAPSMDNLAGAQVTAFERFKAFSVGSRQVVQQCMDAILSLGTKPTNSFYIPPMDYKSILNCASFFSVGAVPVNTAALIRHLVVKDEAGSIVRGTTYEGTIRAACAKVLSIPVDEIEETIPLSGYGLDSLTAARLKGTLKAEFNMEVTQIQLLSTRTTVEKLLAMGAEQAAAAQQAQSSVNEQDASPADGASTENAMDETVVPLNHIKDGQPVFLVHGAGGGILVLCKIMQKVQVPVYGIQDTPDAPLTGNIHDLSAFYLEKIRQKQKTGPYRIGGFSFGTAVAFSIAQMLHAAGETVEMFVMLEGAPMLFRLPAMREYLRRMIKDGTISEEILGLVEDMVTSGSLDDAEDILLQFEEHFKTGNRGFKWVARFCQAFVAHILMGIRESMDWSRREREGEVVFTWPIKRTVLLRAESGTKTNPHMYEASEAWNMDELTDKVEVYEFPGTHFGFLNPKNGVGEALNSILVEIPASA